MALCHMVGREIRQRKLSFGLGALAASVSVGVLVTVLTSLAVYDRDTTRVLAAKQQETEARLKVLNDDMRKAMLKLSFNLVILPKEQELREWYARDYADTYMPESYVTQLADSGIITVRHFLPCLQEKTRWPEKDQTIILVGTRGEVPNLHKKPKRPLVEPVEPGTIVVGHELQQRHGLAVGDQIRLMGRSFTVAKCHEERGSRDDITLWIHLKEAQELLGKEAKINAILALECLCAGAEGLARIRAEVARILPGTQVVEMGTKALARAEARQDVAREAKRAVAQEKAGRARVRAGIGRFAALLTPFVVVAAVIWVTILAFTNARDRRSEIGILRAMGYGSGQVLFLLLARAAAMGVLGGVLGFAVGCLLGSRLAPESASDVAERIPRVTELLDPGLLVLALVVATALTTAATWIPALLAAREDPATALRGD